jgi:hypothetical protein
VAAALRVVTAVAGTGIGVVAGIVTVAVGTGIEVGVVTVVVGIAARAATAIRTGLSFPSKTSSKRVSSSPLRRS